MNSAISEQSNVGQVAVFGSQGQVGARLMEYLGAHGVGFHRGIVDLSDMTAVKRILADLPPVSAVINAAAYTQVDKAETERDLTMALNRDLPKILANWCREKNIPLVHYSTDYVYSGKGTQAWRETDAVSPVNFYGQTKLEGENAVVASGANYLIFRTSWVFDSVGKNFVKTIIRLAQEREELKIVADQVGAPTNARHLAYASLRCLHAAQEKSSFPSGIYNCAGAGETNWYEFAKAIVASVKPPQKVQRVLPINSDEFPTPARRPQNSRLDASKLLSVFGYTMPPWQQGLGECLWDLGLLERSKEQNAET